jgi:hypothetical protein
MAEVITMPSLAERQATIEARRVTDEFERIIAANPSDATLKAVQKALGLVDMASIKPMSPEALEDALRAPLHTPEFEEAMRSAREGGFDFEAAAIESAREKHARRHGPRRKKVRLRLVVS